MWLIAGTAIRHCRGTTQNSVCKLITELPTRTGDWHRDIRIFLSSGVNDANDAGWTMKIYTYSYPNPVMLI